MIKTMLLSENENVRFIANRAMCDKRTVIGCNIYLEQCYLIKIDNMLRLPILRLFSYSQDELVTIVAVKELVDGDVDAYSPIEKNL